jgi:outer membrane murein-binding lipoprotein Lpp
MPSIDPECSKDLKSRAAQLAADIGDHRAKVAQLESDKQVFRTRPIEEFAIGEPEIFRDRHTGLIVAECRLRERLTELDTAHRAELSELRGRAFTAFEKARAEIHQKLLALGYRERIPGVCDVSDIEPIFVFKHPKVRAAHDRNEELGGKINDRSFTQENNAAIAEIKRQLEALRERLSAV